MEITEMETTIQALSDRNDRMQQQVDDLQRLNVNQMSRINDLLTLLGSSEASNLELDKERYDRLAVCGKWNEILNEAADDADLCSSYEAALQELNDVPNSPYYWVGREVEQEYKVTGTFTFRFTQSYIRGSEPERDTLCGDADEFLSDVEIGTAFTYDINEVDEY